MKRFDSTAITNNFETGKKEYELTNNLGNVMVTISDKPIKVFNSSGELLYYKADVISAQDYYPGGMELPGRTYTTTNNSYRYSINGQEKTPEIAPNTTTAEYWQYDARIVRRWNVDPVVKVQESPYLCFAGNPVALSDPLGDKVKGTNENSANATLSAIKEITSEIKGGDKLDNYFKIGDDKLTFDQIDKASFDQTVNDLNLSDEQKALLNGYVNAINDDQTHFVAIVKPDEKIDLEILKDVAKNLYNQYNGKTLNQIPGGEGTTPESQSWRATLSIISSVPTDCPADQFFPNGSFVQSISFVLTHELIGHALSGTYFLNQWAKKQLEEIQSGQKPRGDPTLLEVLKSNNLSAVQVNNIYFKAMGIKKEDQGQYHNREEVVGAPPGPPMDEKERNSIPEYLK